MVAHILEKPSMTFAGVKYNTYKVDRNTGELMLIANFGAIQSLTNPRPQDLVNYLLMISAQNKVIKNTQFHAVISARGREYNKQELTKAAVMWLKEMKYGNQPYLIIFHKDTDNHHVHIVSSRVGKDGKQIDRDYEQVRAVRNIDQVLGYSFGMKYHFSTRAQFYLILENQGFIGRDYINEEKLQKRSLRIGLIN
ncbi:relaxase/mobilization nuclease domain-containing protein [Mucilaginibacter antarcticus]|uniref:relaxase/mobilization nuclease domain-containing protein n=1 Tax=Mucilaginibacter antarcticus TaxID=1855725 RepID=UPI00362CAF48